MSDASLSDLSNMDDLTELQLTDLDFEFPASIADELKLVTPPPSPQQQQKQQLSQQMGVEMFIKREPKSEPFENGMDYKPNFEMNFLKTECSSPRPVSFSPPLSNNSDSMVPHTPPEQKRRYPNSNLSFYLIYLKLGSIKKCEF